MAARWKLVQSFIREATEKADYSAETDPTVVYAKLRALQRGSYEVATSAGGLLQVSSTIGDTSFAFSVPAGTSPADLIETAETALELISPCTTVAEMRALLVRRKTTTPSFTGLRL